MAQKVCKVQMHHKHSDY